MARSQWKSSRKKTGGLYGQMRKKRRLDLGSDFLPVRLEPTTRKKLRGLGGNIKSRMLTADKAIITDPVTHAAKTVKIITVKQNAANPNYARMNIITKGAVIETEAGLARVTSRPGQHGAVIAVLIKK
jgi:small subunit ribosomal protein S8e